MPYTLNLATKKASLTKSPLKETSGLFAIIGKLTIWKDISLPQKLNLIEKPRVGLISKRRYHPQKIQFDVLDDSRWQANIEAKQGRFQLDRYRPFAFQHGSLVYNPRDHEWIPNATDNPWAICPGKNPEHEYHVIHSLGWSLQLTDITLTFDEKSESIYYGKIRFKCDLERNYCPPKHTIKANFIWEP